MATDVADDMWKSEQPTEVNYQQWKSKLNSLLHKCFTKKRITSNKQIYNKEIRTLINKRKYLKNRLPKSKKLKKKISRLNYLIDDKISDFNRGAPRAPQARESGAP